MALAPGDHVTGLRGVYRVQAVHGQGSFGVTYRATDVAGSPVILKELRIEKLQDWKALELFEREGEVLATLSHPNIPAFRDFFAHGGPAPQPVSAMSSYEGPAQLSLVLVQQLIEGSTLQQRLDRAQPLAPDDAERILRELLAALRYLHERDPALVHRDIKPGNLILTPDDRPYLVDFGAVQNRLRRGDSVGSTIVGTLGFMPLEQLRGQAVPASDLYALGMTMVVALAGQPPEQLPVDESSGKVAIDRVLPAGTPTTLRDALDTMIEVLAGHRVHSAAEVLTRLDAVPTPVPAQPVEEAAIEDDPPPAPPSSPHQLVDPLTRRERRRRRALAQVVLPVEPVVPPPIRRFLGGFGYEALMVALALAVPAVILIAKNTGGHATPGQSGTGASTAQADTLFGTTLTTKFQTINVRDLPKDTRFAIWPPPAWVERVATSWKPGAKLAGMVAGHVDASGFVTLGGPSADASVDYSYVADHCCYSGFSSGQRTNGTLDILVYAPDGAVRVGFAESPNTSDRPAGSFCPLPQAFAALAKAGRLPTGSSYDVRNYQPGVAARWDFSTDHFVRIFGAVDVTTCEVVK